MKKAKCYVCGSKKVEYIGNNRFKCENGHIGLF